MGKVAATHFLQMLYRTENFPATILRLFLTYGPGQDGRRFLPQVITGCLEGRSFPASEGKQLRDFASSRIRLRQYSQPLQILPRRAKLLMLVQVNLFPFAK